MCLEWQNESKARTLAHSLWERWQVRSIVTSAADAQVNIRRVRVERVLSRGLKGAMPHVLSQVRSGRVVILNPYDVTSKVATSIVDRPEFDACTVL